MTSATSESSKTSPVSVRLRPEVSAQVAAIAQALDRPKSWVIEQAVLEFVQAQAWQIAAIEDGIRAADAGRVVPHDAVAAWVRSWDQPDERPMPECE